MPVRRASLLALALLLATACSRPSAPLEAGGVAPDFRAVDLTGKTIYLNAELTRPTVLTFFATWCAPCRDEIPLLIDLHRRYAGRAGVLCVVIDPENKGKVRSLATGLQIPYPVLMDEGGDIGRAYRVSALPVTFLLGTDGRIRSRFGAFGETEATALARELDRLLKGAP